jgi:exonuclease VII large subunit
MAAQYLQKSKIKNQKSKIKNQKLKVKSLQVNIQFKADNTMKTNSQTLKLSNFQTFKLSNFQILKRFLAVIGRVSTFDITEHYFNKS